MNEDKRQIRKVKQIYLALPERGKIELFKGQAKLLNEFAVAAIRLQAQKYLTK